MDINLENREINPRKITSDSIINNILISKNKKFFFIYFL